MCVIGVLHRYVDMMFGWFLLPVALFFVCALLFCCMRFVACALLWMEACNLHFQSRTPTSNRTAAKTPTCHNMKRCSQANIQPGTYGLRFYYK
jgi:hypothetical protein